MDDWWFLIVPASIYAVAWLIAWRQAYWRRREEQAKHERLMQEVRRHPANGPQP